MSGAAASASSSMHIAGLTLEIATTSFCRPGIATLKFTSFRDTTRNGPTYGDAREDVTPPLRTKTWVHVCRSAGR